MTFSDLHSEISLDRVVPEAEARKAEGWRFVQVLAVNAPDGIDIVYSYMKDGVLDNLMVRGVKKGTPVPSISSEFLAAFVFENEMHDLFGVEVTGLAIDFQGRFYDLSVKEPMTIISASKKAELDKAAKVKAALEAKAKKAAGAVKSLLDEETEAKLAAMEPEKAAKLRAALEAKAKKALDAAKSLLDEETEAKLAAMEPEKAAKLRAALEAKARKALAAAKDGESHE